MVALNNNKGVLVGASIGLIFGVVVVVFIIILMVNLFSPVYNETDKISESYFKQLKNNIALADDSKSASFYMLDNGEKDSNFYLVYFGNVLSFSHGDGVLYDVFGVGGMNFASSKNGKNIICICSLKHKRTLCKYCVDLDLSAVSNVRSNNNSWIIGGGDNINIIKKGGKYVFFVG